MRYSCLIAVLLSLCSVQFLLAEDIVDRNVKLEEISTEFGLADGPAWDGNWALYIPDVKGQKLYRYIPAKKELQVVLPEAGRISATYYAEGKLYLSDNANAAINILNGKETQLVAKTDTSEKPANRPNDLVVDHQGGVYVTLTKPGQVMYISAAGKTSIAVSDINTPNGITLSPDGKTLYVSSYVPKKVWSYSVDAPGKTSQGKMFSELDSGPEKGADGMTMDRAGNVYCTGPGHVWIWNPSGTLLAKIETPTKPINCTFGGKDMRDLYITCFGGLYMQRMNAYGLPPLPATEAKDQSSDNTNRPATTLPDNVTPHLDVVYAQVGDRKLLADIFVPQKKNRALPAVVVVHGGGWLNSYKSKFRALAQELASRGYVTMAIEYRLGYEAKFPAGIQDCNASVRFLRANASQYQVDPNRIAAVGGSAGGHLVGLMATGFHDIQLQGNGGNQEQSSKLQAAVVMAGPLEMLSGSVAERSRKNPNESNSIVWLGKTVDEDPELYQLADAYLHITKAAPPILFMTGEHDNPDRNEPTREKLRALGITTDIKVYKDGKHGCWNQLPWFKEMTADIDIFLQEQLK
ncbi:MAG: SMP-30/gluconolactonase/LRE family protein [Pirellulales bacterium]